MTEVRDTDVLFKRDSILGGRAIHFGLASCPQNGDFFSLGETEVQKALQSLVSLSQKDKS